MNAALLSGAAHGCSPAPTVAVSERLQCTHPDRHGKTQQRRSTGLACRRAAPYRRSSGLPTARAAALELEAARNPRRCRLTISHHGLGRMLTSIKEIVRELKGKPPASTAGGSDQAAAA
jgi:hypothetical protein